MWDWPQKVAAEFGSDSDWADMSVTHEIQVQDCLNYLKKVIIVYSLFLFDLESVAGVAACGGVILIVLTIAGIWLYRRYLFIF